MAATPASPRAALTGHPAAAKIGSASARSTRTRSSNGWSVKTYGPGDTIELEPGVRITVDELYAR